MKIADVLSQIPLETWNTIVEKEPEWQFLVNYLERYDFGKFAVLMLTAGLNDFQLKGKAEVAYWPGLKEILDRYPVPSSIKELRQILSGFYGSERLPKLKLKRLNHFLFSELAKKLWSAKPDEVAGDYLQIWYELADVMNQEREAKTITFAMKCIGISILIAGRTDFEFEQIPIPVDYRVRTFTERLSVSANDDDVRRFWSHIMAELGESLAINMIHLDSLIWQIGTLSRSEIVEYFSKLSLKQVGEKLAEMVRE